MPDPQPKKDFTLPAWTQSGLRFQCTECGKCCSGGNGYVWMTEPEIRSLAAHLGMTVDEFGTRYLRRIGQGYSLLEKPGSGACIFLDGAHCSVYEHRPSQCRNYPFWPRVLETPASWKAEAAQCEGIRDDAPQVSPTDIQRILKG